MIRTLRITSIILSAIAVAIVVFLLLLGLRGNSEISAFLAEKGVIETLKSRDTTETKKEDAVSPLVLQASKFALRIDPPPPPPPVSVHGEPVQDNSRPERVSPPIVTPPQTSGRFSLLATARSETQPERSLALVKPATGSAKWHRQGETLGHLEIREIRDGSIVLYQGDQMNSELHMPPRTPSSRPLLKSDAAGWSGGVSTSVENAFSPSEAEAFEPPARPSSLPTRPARGAGRPSVARTVPSPAAAERISTAPAPLPPPEPMPEPTPEEQKESINQSISSIQEIMERSEGQTSEEQRLEEQAAWMQLLQALEQEKAALESGGQSDAKPNP